MDWPALAMVNDACVDAELKFASPDWVAFRAHAPAAVMCTTPAPVTVHGPETRPYFTGRPDNAVAVAVKSGSR